MSSLDAFRSHANSIHAKLAGIEVDPDERDQLHAVTEQDFARLVELADHVGSHALWAAKAAQRAHAAAHAVFSIPHDADVPHATRARIQDAARETLHAVTAALNHLAYGEF